MKKKLAKRFGAVTMATVMGVAPVTAFSADNNFTDLPDSHWAKATILEWANAGLINGYTDGTIRPDATITRAEFAKMLNTMLGLTDAGAEHGFSDIAGHWAEEQVMIAVKAGYTTGKTATTFAPDALVTREEAATFVARALSMTGGGDISGFADADKISSWAVDTVGAMTAAGYIQGDASGYRPADNLTRAEAITILERVRKDQGSMPSVDTAALVIDKTETKISDQTIDGDVVITSTVREGNVYFENVHITGDILVQGGGSNSVYFKDCTVDGAVILDKSNVRIEVSGDTILNAISVLKVAHIDSKDFTGEIKKLTLSNALSTTDTVKIDVDITELVIDAIVKVQISSEIGKVHVTENGAGSTVTLDKSAQVDNFVADGKVTISGSGNIGVLDTKVDGVVVGGSVSVEKENVDSAVSGGATSGGTGTGSASGSGDNTTGDNNTNTDTNTDSNTTTSPSTSKQYGLYILDEDGVTGNVYKAGDEFSLSSMSTNMPSLRLEGVSADKTKPYIQFRDSSDVEYYVEWIVSAKDANGEDADIQDVFADVSTIDDDDYETYEKYIADLEGTLDAAQVKEGGSGLQNEASMVTFADEKINFTISDTVEDTTVTIVARYYSFDRSKSTISDATTIMKTSNPISFTTVTDDINTYDKLKATIEDLDNQATQDVYKKSVEYTLDNASAPKYYYYDAYVIPVVGDIKTAGKTASDMATINYTGELPLILVAADGSIDISALNISSPNAPVSIDANVTGLEEGFGSADTSDYGGNNGSVAPNVYEMPASGDIADIADADSATGAPADYNGTLTVGSMIINSPEQTFATSAPIGDLTIEAAGQVIADAVITDTTVLAGAGDGNSHKGSYGTGNTNIPSLSPGTSGDLSVPNADTVWLRSTTDTFVNGSNYDANVSSGAGSYVNVTTYEDILTTSDIAKLVTMGDGIYVDVLTDGYNTLQSGVGAYEYDKNGVGDADKMTKVTLVEAHGSIYVVGAGSVENVSVVALPDRTVSDEAPVVIRVETIGNYFRVGGNDTSEDQYGPGTEVKGVSVGVVNGLFEDGFEDLVKAYGGLYYVEDVATARPLDEIKQFLSAPVITNLDDIATIEWTADGKTVEIVAEQANGDDYVIKFKVQGDTSDEEATLNGDDELVCEVEYAEVLVRPYLTAPYTNSVENYIEKMEAMAAATHATGEDYANPDDINMKVEVWVEKTGGTSGTYDEQSSVVTVPVKLIAPITNGETQLDAEIVRANVITSLGNNSNNFKLEVGSVDTNGAINFGSTQISSINPVDFATGDTLTPQEVLGSKVDQGVYANIFAEKDATTGENVVYVYLGEGFEAVEDKLEAVLTAEYEGFADQDAINEARLELKDVVDAMDNSKLDVTELLKYMAIYNHLATSTPLEVYTTSSWNEFAAATAKDTITSQDTLNGVVAEIKDKLEKLALKSDFVEFNDYQTYFGDTDADADWKTDYKDMYTGASWATFETKIATIADKYKDLSEANFKKADVVSAIAEYDAAIKALNPKVELAGTDSLADIRVYETAVAGLNAPTPLTELELAAEYLNSRYIYTNVSTTDEVSTFTTLVGEDILDEDGVTVLDTAASYKFTSIAIDVKMNADSLYTPDNVAYQSGSSSEGIRNLFVQSVNSLAEQFDQASDSDEENIYKYWVNLGLEGVAFEGSSESGEAGTTAFDNSKVQSILSDNGKIEDAAGIDTLLEGDYTGTLDGRADVGLDDTTIGIYIPVDNYLGGVAGTENVNVNPYLDSTTESYFTGTDIGIMQGAKAYQYIVIESSKFAIPKADGTVGKEVEIDSVVIEVEVNFEDKNWAQFDETYQKNISNTDAKGYYGYIAADSANTTDNSTTVAGLYLGGATLVPNYGMLYTSVGGDDFTYGQFVLRVNGGDTGTGTPFTWNHSITDSGITVVSDPTQQTSWVALAEHVNFDEEINATVEFEQNEDAGIAIPDGIELGEFTETETETVSDEINE